MSMTLGEFRVDVTHNPSQNPSVDVVKAFGAKLIDMMDAIPVDTTFQPMVQGEINRLKAMAMSHIEQGISDAVKAITKQDPGEIRRSRTTVGEPEPSPLKVPDLFSDTIRAAVGDWPKDPLRRQQYRERGADFMEFILDRLRSVGIIAVSREDVKAELDNMDELHRQSWGKLK